VVVVIVILNVCGLQAKPDAGKLVLATMALLVASLSNILVVGIRHLL
jgi:hypothetical protein